MVLRLLTALAAPLRDEIEPIVSKLGEETYMSEGEAPALAAILAADPKAADGILKRYPKPRLDRTRTQIGRGRRSRRCCSGSRSGGPTG